MQETWKFVNLSAPEVGNGTLSLWLKEVLDNYSKEMGIFLSYYYRKDGAVVEGVSLIPPSSELMEKTGSIAVSFQLVHFNACLNIHESNVETMSLSYEISEDGTELTLTGPYWPERDSEDH